MQRHYIIGLLLTTLFPTATFAQQAEYETTEVADGVYRFRFRAHNNLFVVTDDGIIAFDPISATAAERYAEEMKRVAPGTPLRMVVYSHDHADHASGANVLRDAFGGDVVIVAQENARQRIVDANSPDLPPPDLTFSDQLTLHVGGRTIELHYLGKSHSDNMIVALLPAEKLAFAVDFVANDRVGYQTLPDYYFPDFFHALERLQGLEYERIVFGHGPPGDRSSIRRQGQYYGDLRRAVTDAIENGLSEEEAVEQVRLPAYAGWGQYDDWFPMNVRAIYQWLASR